MSNGKNCNTQRQKTRFSRVKKLPARPVPGTIYIVESNVPGLADMYAVDNSGNVRIIVDSSRFLAEGGDSQNLSLIDYRSDIMSVGSYYYYGYQFEDGSYKIIRVEKGNTNNQQKADTSIGSYEDNWTNRQTLTYI